MCFGNSLSHGNECFFLPFLNKLGPKPYSIGNVVHHIHYRGIQQEYIRVWHFLLYFCLINFGKKSCQSKVRYVTTWIRTYIPYMIHPNYHHIPRTYIDRIATKCFNRTKIIKLKGLLISSLFLHCTCCTRDWIDTHSKWHYR